MSRRSDDREADRLAERILTAGSHTPPADRSPGQDQGTRQADRLAEEILTAGERPRPRDPDDDVRADLLARQVLSAGAAIEERTERSAGTAATSEDNLASDILIAGRRTDRETAPEDRAGSARSARPRRTRTRSAGEPAAERSHWRRHGDRVYVEDPSEIPELAQAFDLTLEELEALNLRPLDQIGGRGRWLRIAGGGRGVSG